MPVDCWLNALLNLNSHKLDTELVHASNLKHTTKLICSPPLASD